TAFLAGSWATDDSGTLFLNGANTGFKSGGFGGFFTFNLTRGFVSGTNILQFPVNYRAVGYTSLWVQKIPGHPRQAAPPPPHPPGSHPTRRAHQSHRPPV